MIVRGLVWSTRRQDDGGRYRKILVGRGNTELRGCVEVVPHGAAARFARYITYSMFIHQGYHMISLDSLDTSTIEYNRWTSNPTYYDAKYGD